MGSLLSSSNRHEVPERRQGINQIYNAEFGYAPIGPIGTLPSVPKNNINARHRHRRRRRY